MVYTFRVTLTGIKGFYRVYKVNGINSLYSFHKQMRTDMEFPLDQMMLFKGLDANGNVVARYSQVDLGAGTVDEVSIAQAVAKGIRSFTYFYDTTNKKSVTVTLEEKEEKSSILSPTLTDIKGPNPIEFENGYVAFEDLPDEQRHLPSESDKARSKKGGGGLAGLLSAIAGDDEGGDEDLGDDEDEEMDGEDFFEEEDEEEDEERPEHEGRLAPRERRTRVTGVSRDRHADRRDDGDERADGRNAKQLEGALIGELLIVPQRRRDRRDDRTRDERRDERIARRLDERRDRRRDAAPRRLRDEHERGEQHEDRARTATVENRLLGPRFLSWIATMMETTRMMSERMRTVVDGELTARPMIGSCLLMTSACIMRSARMSCPICRICQVSPAGIM